MQNTLFSIISIIIQFVIAIGAIGAFIYSKLTFESNKKEKRAIFAPTPIDSEYKVNADKKFKYITFSLTNFGVNPLNKARGKIHCYTKKDMTASFDSPRLPFWGMDCYYSNPLPQTGKWTIKYIIEHPQNCDYIIFMVSYMDVSLNKRFEDVFYWKTENHRLVEVNAGEYKTLVKLAKYVENDRHDLSSV